MEQGCALRTNEIKPPEMEPLRTINLCDIKENINLKTEECVTFNPDGTGMDVFVFYGSYKGSMSPDRILSVLKRKKEKHGLPTYYLYGKVRSSDHNKKTSLPDYEALDDGDFTVEEMRRVSQYIPDYAVPVDLIK